MLYKKKFLLKTISDKKKQKNKNFFLSFKKLNNASYNNIKNKIIKQNNILLPKTVIITPFVSKEIDLININETILIKYNNLLVFPNQIKKIDKKQLINKTTFLLNCVSKFYFILQTLSKKI